MKRDLMATLQTRVEAAARRVRSLRAREIGLRTLFVAWFGGAFFVLADRVRLIREPGPPVVSGPGGFLGLLGAGLLLALLVALVVRFRRPAREPLLIDLDARVGLKQGLLTVFELEGDLTGLGSLLILDMERRTRGLDPRALYRPTPLGARVAILAGVAVVFMALAVPAPAYRGPAPPATTSMERHRDAPARVSLPKPRVIPTERPDPRLVALPRPVPRSGGGGAGGGAPQEPGRPGQLYGEEDRHPGRWVPEPMEAFEDEGGWVSKELPIYLGDSGQGSAAADPSGSAPLAEVLPRLRRQAEAVMELAGYGIEVRNRVLRYFRTLEEGIEREEGE